MPRWVNSTPHLSHIWDEGFGFSESKRAFVSSQGAIVVTRQRIIDDNDGTSGQGVCGPILITHVVLRVRGLWLHSNAAGFAMEVGTVFSCDYLEARRDSMNGRRLVAVSLRKAGRASVAALRASQLFIPFIGHAANI